MPFYIRPDWRMSAQGREEFTRLKPDIEPIVRRHISKYRLPSMEPEDLYQEAMLAAAYAVDTFDPSRGVNILGYVGRVIWRAMTMVAGGQLAPCRQPHIHQQDEDGWRRVPAPFSDFDPDDIPALGNFEMDVIARETAREARAGRIKRRKLLRRYALSDDARTVLEMKMSPPAELCVAARNMYHGRYHPPGCHVMARYMGWDEERVRTATRELRQKFKGAPL